MGCTAAVIGASGYAGGELLRLLARHPAIQLQAASARSAAGRAIGEVHPHLAKLGVADFIATDEALAAGTDLVFSCLPEDSQDLTAGASAVVVDLSDRHRASDGWVYGLTEFTRGDLKTKLVANPGCYPTAALLCLVPFVRAGMVEGPVVVDALSGVSGAGRKAEDRLLFGSVAENVGAYGELDHRHVPEIERGLERFGGSALNVSFTPHLVPMARGLLVTARARLTEQIDDRAAVEVLNQAYAGESFIHVKASWPQTSAAAGTNDAWVSARVDARNGLLVASAAIDNLGKGAAGQAIQNANVALGLDEGLGLDLIGARP